MFATALRSIAFVIRSAVVVVVMFLLGILISFLAYMFFGDTGVIVWAAIGALLIIRGVLDLAR